MKIEKGFYRTSSGVEAVVVKPVQVGINTWLWVGAIVTGNVLHITRWDNQGGNLVHGAPYNLDLKVEKNV